MIHRHALTSLLLLLLLLGGAGSAAAFQEDVGYYLSKEAAPKKGGILDEEVLRYRSYPRLDRAYRMQRAGRLGESRREFLAYLALVPADIRVRFSYLELLEKMSLDKEAIGQADLILRRRPAFVPAYLHKGAALQRLGKPDQAFEAYRKAAAISGIRREDRVFALSAAAELALSRKRWANATAVLRPLAELEGKGAWYLREGYAFEMGGETRDALDAYGRALELARSPEEKVAAALPLAEATRKLNLWGEAERCYRTALESDPGNRKALIGLANVAYREKRYDEAEKWLLQLKPGGLEPEQRRFLANLYLERREYAAAIEQLKPLLRLEGRQGKRETLASLAQAYESAGKLRESSECYRLLLARGPGKGETQFRYGTLLTRMGRWREAGAALEKALSMELTFDQRSAAHDTLSLVYEKQGNYGKAARELEQSLLNQPSPKAGSLMRLATLLNRAGRQEQAQRTLERALALPSLGDDLKREAYRLQSAMLEQEGKRGEAAAAMEKAMRLGAGTDPANGLRLAVLLDEAGRPAEALDQVDRVLARPSLDERTRLAALKEKGALLEKEGRPLEAAREFEELLALGNRSPELYLTLANLYLAGGRAETAIGYFRKVLDRHDAKAAERCSALDGLGMAFFKTGGTEEAVSPLSLGLQRCGESWQRHYYLGLALFRSGKWEQALEQFQLSEGQKEDAAALVGIALCHQKLGRPGAAIHYLLLAAHSSGSTPGELKQINDTLGYLYAEENAYDKAAAAFARSLAQVDDNLIRLKLAGVLNLDGKTDRSWQALQEVAPDRFSPAERTEYDDLKAGLLQKLGRRAEAEALMEQTQKRQPSAARAYALGELYQQQGAHPKALAFFSAAHEQEPQQVEYASALGYAYGAEGRLSDAIGTFEGVLARDPGNERVREELGYLNVHAGNNEQAAQWFRQALDTLPEMPQDSQEQREQREKDRHRLQSEIGKLSRSFAGVLYASYRSGNAPSTLLASGGQGFAGQTGDVGAEVAYRPPVIGLLDDRVLELFGRAFGNLDANTLRYDDRSTQAGVGLRYKFLKSENLWVSAEKLFKVGKNALDDWLFRLLYSRGAGLAPDPLERNRDYYLLYGEVDGYYPSGTAAIYAEGRKGRAFTLGSDYLLTPHLVADGRWQSPFNEGGNYLEGGAGIILGYFFNATHYENYRNVVDLSVTYKHGAFFSQGFGGTLRDYDSVLVNLELSF